MPAGMGSWRTVGASVVGTSHLAQGRCCDDYHAMRVLSDGTLIVAVADGAGSAARAREGAVTAVETALASLADVLEQRGEPPSAAGWQAVLAGAVQAARAGLNVLASQSSPIPQQQNDEPPESQPLANLETPAHERAQTVQVPSDPLRQFATTLIVVVVTGSIVAAAQVGDGAAIVQTRQGALSAITWPDHGEYINESTFVTDPDYLRHLQLYVLPQASDVTGVAVFSDGLQLLALDMANKVPHPPFFDPLFAFAGRPDASEQELISFLESDRVCARTDDDKTLALATRA